MSSGGVTLLLVISFLGILGSLALLAFAWREWQRERLEKQRGIPQPVAGSDESEPPRGAEPGAHGDESRDALGVADSANPSEVLRVYRDLGTGDLFLEIDGRRYRRVTDIRDGAVGRRLLATLGDLQRWIRAATKDAGPTARRPSARSASPPAAAPFGRSLRTKPRPSRAPAPGGEAPQDMIEAIDGIIQSRLPASPLAGRQINMQAAPDGGAQIVVDGRIYEGVSEVTDPTVREFIQSAVAEWERSV